MPDQADHLRNLMHGAKYAPGDGPGPQLIVLAGAKGGVGTTTVAVNLAVALSQQGRQTILVDGDLGKSGVAALCGGNGGATIADVLCGRRGVEEALRPGPAGMRLLVGAWATGQLTDCDPTAQQRLIAGLKALSDVDVFVMDAGCGLHSILERFWRAADRVLVVTTPDDTAVMDAYATLKAMAVRHREIPVYAVMNRVMRYDDAPDASARLAQACRRFLAIEVPCVANVMASEDVAAAARRQAPFVLNAQVCQATRAIQQLAQFLMNKGLGVQGSGFRKSIQASPGGQPILRPGVGRMSAGKM